MTIIIIILIKRIKLSISLSFNGSSRESDDGELLAMASELSRRYKNNALEKVGLPLKRSFYKKEDKFHPLSH